MGASGKAVPDDPEQKSRSGSGLTASILRLATDSPQPILGGMLDAQQFLAIVDATPLVSIDLIVRNARGQVLLGLRVNRPAQGLWFVPGGRIRKNERVAQALERISNFELGHTIRAARLLGVYDHIYEDNFHGQAGINTHYVVMAYEYQLPEGVVPRADPQHETLAWWEVRALLDSAQVHDHTKAYFRHSAPN